MAFYIKVVDCSNTMLQWYAVERKWRAGFRDGVLQLHMEAQSKVPDTGALQHVEVHIHPMRALQAKAVDSLAAFFEACAQMELADFKDHVKALQVWTAASGSMWQPVGPCSQMQHAVSLWQQHGGVAAACGAC